MVFTQLKRFQDWLYGDVTSATFETRKTFFETLLGIFGFFIVGKAIKETLGEDVL